MSQAKDLLKQLFPTSNPAEAAQGSTGERIASPPPPKERKEGDWLPVVAVGVGVALLALAFLRPAKPSAVAVALQGPSRSPQRSEPTQESFDSDWPTTEPGY